MGKNLKKAEPRVILKRTLAASAMLPVIAGLTACSSQETAETGSAPESPVGIYTNVMDFEQASSRLSGTQAMNSESETVGQLSSVTVFNTADTAQVDENGEVVLDDLGSIVVAEPGTEGAECYKYIFSKTVIICGEDWPYYVRGQYTGYCTYDQETGEITMYTPERFMTYRVQEGEPIWEWDGVDNSTNPEVTQEILDSATSGLNFSSEWQDYHAYTRPDALNAVLSDDNTFSYVSQYLSENTFDQTLDDSYFEDGGDEYDMDALIPADAAEE